MSSSKDYDLFRQCHLPKSKIISVTESQAKNQSQKDFKFSPSLNPD
jgi:hypothetical protein